MDFWQVRISGRLDFRYNFVYPGLEINFGGDGSIAKPGPASTYNMVAWFGILALKYKVQVESILALDTLEVALIQLV